MDGLVGRFAFADYGYTRDMEESLDQIAAGKVQYRAVVAEAHAQLEKELSAFVQASGGRICPQMKQ